MCTEVPDQGKPTQSCLTPVLNLGTACMNRVNRGSGGGVCGGASYCAKSQHHQQAGPAHLSLGCLEAQAPTAGGPWGAGWAGVSAQPLPSALEPSSRKRARASHQVCFSWLWKDDGPRLWWEDGPGSLRGTGLTSRVPSSREGPSGQVSAPGKLNTTEPIPAPVSSCLSWQLP